MHQNSILQTKLKNKIYSNYFTDEIKKKLIVIVTNCWSKCGGKNGIKTNIRIYIDKVYKQNSVLINF